MERTHCFRKKAGGRNMPMFYIVGASHLDFAFVEHIFLVDQPPGTGFSYVSTDKFVHELDEVRS